MGKQQNHLPDRTLFALPEQNLVVAVIRQAWLDTFDDRESIRVERSSARSFFGGRLEKDGFRQSLANLCDVIGVDDEYIASAWRRYEKARSEGRTNAEPKKAFSIMMNAAVEGRKQ